MLRKLLEPGVPRLTPRAGPRRARVLVPLTAVLALLLAAVPALATARPPGQGAGTFATSFETGEPAPTWTSTPEVDAKGQKLASGVGGSAILERGPSSPGGDDLLGHPTGELAWEGPFQNGVGQVPGTMTPTTTPTGDSATRWQMQSQGETWIHVLMPGLTPGTGYRAQVTLQGSGQLFLNAWSGSSDIGGQYITLTAQPQTVTVDFTTPATGGTAAFQVRTTSERLTHSFRGRPCTG